MRAMLGYGVLELYLCTVSYESIDRWICACLRACGAALKALKDSSAVPRDRCSAAMGGSSAGKAVRDPCLLGYLYRDVVNNTAGREEKAEMWLRGQ